MVGKLGMSAANAGQGCISNGIAEVTRHLQARGRTCPPQKLEVKCRSLGRGVGDGHDQR
jgi:hypothetical protein